MHELGIMTGVIEAAEKAARDSGATRLLKVNLSIGEMTEAIEDALVFAWEALTEDDPYAKGAELAINMIKPKSRCLECGAVFEHDRFHMFCPECDGFATELLCGSYRSTRSKSTCPTMRKEIPMKIDMKQPILDKNDAIARELRERFAEHHVYVVDLLASPGSGKTSTILATIDALRDEFNIAVIEGDIASSVDAEKIKAQGIAAVQINTGGACHLESAMIKRAIDVLDLERLDLIIVENVGNLVCPTDFDLGENAKVMILSVPEGDDKPLKYPGVFQVSEAVILNKVDTMPVFNFNQEAFEESVNQLNPQAPIFPLSATTGEGLEAWTSWLAERIRKA